MSEAGGEEREVAAAVAWLALSDALLRGVGHAMNNRAAALSAVVQVLASSGPEGPLESALRSETERLQRVVELLRLLPRRWTSDPEPVLLEDVVPPALDLLALHSDLPETRYDWETAGALPPVLAEPSLLVHVLCLLGAAAAREAGRTGARAVSLRGWSSAERVTVDVVARADHGAPTDGVEPGEAFDPSAVAALLSRAGGELTTGGEEGLTISFSLPTLTAARRRAD